MTPQAPLPFVVGCGRSGTTLLRAMLDSHPELAVVHEAQFVSRMAERRDRYETREGFDTDRFVSDLGRARSFGNLSVTGGEVAAELQRRPPSDLADALRAVLALHAEAAGKPRYGEKSPRHVRHMPMLAALFPEARFVHLLRDGRDAAVAYRDRGFGHQDPVEAAFVWREDVRRARADGVGLGADRYLEVRYEDLVDEPETVLRRVCDFIDLDFDSAMLRFHERADAVVGGVHTTTEGVFDNLHRPVTRGLRDWRRDMAPEDVLRFDTVAGGLLSDLGYEVGHVRPTLPMRLGVARRWCAWKARMVVSRLRLGRRRAAQSSP